MLKLVNITKDYKVADTKVHALRGLSICFRENEFVSVLGPSGCGKTTLLNIIGGLDHATSGDLSVLGKSTKEYKDRDWDVYRNHRVGFIFQSYNLIPHQTVLGNVELALTIAGMSKAERVEKAKAALDKVGLSDQYYKRPNQLSGGQCQRVAIARALVNDPEILLADEPTGALDTVTSKQIMDLIKEIAKERLVIMVTHNPELAQEYSTRIIRLLDGLLVGDTNPFSEENERKKKKEERKIEDGFNAPDKRKEKAKMSFFTAFKLSVQNLFTKKRRTVMTSIAGSIGIIGVSLVLSISIGIQGFIGGMQSDMLAGNPIEIAQTAFDINGMMSGMNRGEQAKFVKDNGCVNIDSMMEQLAQRANAMENMFVENNINRNYVDYLKNMPREYLAALFLDYGLDVSNNIYTNFRDPNPAYPDGRDVSLSGIRSVYSSILGEVEQYKDYAPMISSVAQSFSQAPDAEGYLLTQYEVLYKANGTNGIAKEKDEIMIVLGKDRELADLLLAQLGYFSQDEFVNLVNKAVGGEYDKNMYKEQIEYGRLIGKTFTWYPDDSVFTLTGSNTNPFIYNPYYAGSGGLELKIVGILEPEEGLNYTMLSNGFYYTTTFAEYVVQQNYNSELAQKLRADDKKSFTSMATFMPADSMFPGSPETTLYTGITYDYNYTFNGATKPVKGLVGGADQMMSLLGMFGIGGGAEDDIKVLATTTFGLQDFGANVESVIERDEDGGLISWTVVLENGKAYALPNRIAVYPLDLTQKAHVLKYLDDWNGDGDIVVNGVTLTAADREKITYSDMLSIIMSMISTLVNIITIALVAFTSLALVVSCVMIAIITYVSVVERIKEIGVIRSLGGRKRDISNLFTAETFVIGLVSGLIGIAVTYLLGGLINLLVKAAGIGTIAVFPIWVALIMVGVSIGLTLISGLMPSRSAAKKDPVVALRTE